MLGLIGKLLCLGFGLLIHFVVGSRQKAKLIGALNGKLLPLPDVQHTGEQRPDHEPRGNQDTQKHHDDENHNHHLQPGDQRAQLILRLRLPRRHLPHQHRQTVLHILRNAVLLSAIGIVEYQSAGYVLQFRESHGGILLRNLRGLYGLRVFGKRITVGYDREAHGEILRLHQIH